MAGVRRNTTMTLLWYCYDRDMPELCPGRNGTTSRKSTSKTEIFHLA